MEKIGRKSFSDSLPHGLQRLTFRSVSAKLKKLEFSMTRGGGRDFFRRPDGLQQKYDGFSSTKPSPIVRTTRWGRWGRWEGWLGLLWGVLFQLILKRHADLNFDWFVTSYVADNCCHHHEEEHNFHRPGGWWCSEGCFLASQASSLRLGFDASVFPHPVAIRLDVIILLILVGTCGLQMFSLLS